MFWRRKFSHWFYFSTLNESFKSNLHNGLFRMFVEETFLTIWMYSVQCKVYSVQYLCDAPRTIRTRSSTGEVHNSWKIRVFWILKMRHWDIRSRISIWSRVSIWRCLHRSAEYEQERQGKRGLGGEKLFWFVRAEISMKIYIWDKPQNLHNPLTDKTIFVVESPFKCIIYKYVVKTHTWNISLRFYVCGSQFIIKQEYYSFKFIR